jgi:molybdate/tungstate transport system substrate-binding protein
MLARPTRSAWGNSHPPYIALPEDINLSRDDAHSSHPEINLAVRGKTFYPEPLVFYAASFKDSTNPGGAASFLKWLQGPDSQALFRKNQIQPASDSAPRQS